MRKRLITAVPQVGPRTDRHWFDLASVATVEVTSETKDHPVESALLLNETRGWRAAQPGAQIIRLLFRSPAKGKKNLAGFRRDREDAYAGVCFAMVC